MKALFVALALPLLLAPALTSPAAAEGSAGEFDYYVLSLSWAPSWCRSAEDTRDSNSCDPGRRTGFTVHGLWPQYEAGWPDNCPTTEPNPSRRDTREMVDLMGSSGLAWYQWRKHGRCSGLSASTYFDEIRRATTKIQIPELFSRLNRDVALRAPIIEDAFIESNPGLTRNGITVTCQGGNLQEVRICLTRDLQPRDCAPDSRRDCTSTMTMPAPR
ncbi:ribonuclease T2 family protein [Paracoccus aminophilus]|uniref:Ribonuclease T2 n=1 Tax=Paracoccus aminophilus JCM 7686 TaxID=1367847 RepID=S5XR47_PARAH|nr:ribonuclease T2 [Paracoccus aminophilus]AGT07532.1 ribonuclease T2 [Paracoccus aminophilus JCM 7686]